MTVHPVLDFEDLGVDDLGFLLGVKSEGRTMLVEVGVVVEDTMVAFLGIGDSLTAGGAWAEVGDEDGAISAPKF